MVIRSQTLRLGIFIGTFIIAVIIVFQLIWLGKIYSFEQKEFNHGIAKAIRGFYEDIDDPMQQTATLNEMITSPNDQTFFARLNGGVMNRDTVQSFLQSELEDEDIFTDCYAGIYNASTGKYDQTFYLASATSSKNRVASLPTPPDNANYLVLYFPHRKQYILSRINIWIFSSVLLLIVLILLGASVYYLYRQKFLNELQKDFVNNFTHEFKTPVSVINLAAEVLTNPNIADKPEKLNRYASIVQYQGNYLQGQIERLLHHAYSEKNVLHLQKEVLDMHSLVEEALHNLHSLVMSREATIERNFEAGETAVYGDKNYLLIVITNLIENALKYAVEPKIIISTVNIGNEIVLSVKDNGKGIEKKYRDKIFRKFYRVPNGEQVSARGFGLGLHFVKKIVLAHRGRINVDSIPGVGSDFRIFLPNQ